MRDVYMVKLRAVSLICAANTLTLSFDKPFLSLLAVSELFLAPVDLVSLLATSSALVCRTQSRLGTSYLPAKDTHSIVHRACFPCPFCSCALGLAPVTLASLLAVSSAVVCGR